ncbi:MAG: hypothetical protein FJY09_08480 [Chlorobi bacterium]|nr:hypothetical protein [Chlorobiota bacterium]
MPVLLKKISIWIKFNEAVFRFLGLIFFFLTICAGFIWLIGRDAESVAFILGIISSSMFGIIEVAKYIEPERKAIREMSLDEMLIFIETSDSIKDWKGVTTAYASESVLIEDPRLRITIHHDETGTQCKDFKAYWANMFPNPHADGYWVDITYDRGLIDRVVLVSVDGGRAMLPVPKTTSELVVSKRDYVIACMFNDCSILDQYMQMSGIHHT